MNESTESNIVQLEHYRTEQSSPKSQIVRISSELDGMEALYSSDLSSEHLFTIRILFWALLDDGQVCAVIPWLKEITTTQNLNHSKGRWQGYYDAIQDKIFFKAPEHKTKELELGHQYFQKRKHLSEVSEKNPKSSNTPSNHQELPDHLGTHAAFKHANQKGFYLKPVVSWRLTTNGELQAMVPEEDNLSIMPLPGSDDLSIADNHPEFRYYFQHGIASRLKHEDPNAMTTVSLLIDLV